MGHKRIHISAGFCLGLAMLLLTVPIPWLLAGTLAAAFHEVGHLAAIYLMGGSVRYGSFGVASANLYIPAMSRGKETVAALAGPFFSLLLLMFWPVAPRLALCAGAQLCYNLLPIYPLDGGRILACLIPHRICLCISCIARVCLVAIACWLTFSARIGIFPLLLVLLLLIRTK